MADLDKKIAELNRRREALRGRSRRRAGTGRPVSREAKIARHRRQIKVIHDDILPTMRKNSYGWRVAKNDLENRRAELRVLLGVPKPHDKTRRGKLEYQARR